MFLGNTPITYHSSSQMHAITYKQARTPTRTRAPTRMQETKNSHISLVQLVSRVRYIQKLCIVGLPLPSIRRL